MRREPTTRPENILALATAEIERIKALLSRVTDGRNLVISAGTDADDTTLPIEAGAHTLYGVKHTRSLRVTAGAGLNIDWEQGQIWMGGAFYSIAAATIGGADNDTNYVFVGIDGTVGVNTTGFPTNCWPMAEVTTLAGAITAVVDRRAYGAQIIGDEIILGNPLIVGDDDSSQGTIILYGDGAASTEGGEARFHLAADHDGAFEYWLIEAYEDDLRILRSDGGVVPLTFKADRNLLVGTDREIQFRDTDLAIYSGADGQLNLKADVAVGITAPIVSLPSGVLYVGSDDATEGQLVLYGDNANAGGFADLYVGDGQDTNFNFWTFGIKSGSDDLEWTVTTPAPATSDRMLLTAQGQLQVSVQGVAAGLLLGGDVQLYRGAADVLYIPDSTTILTYLRVGANAAPTNTTAGDITGIRALLGTDEAFGPDTLLNITKASFAPAVGSAAVVDLAVTVAPDAVAPGGNSNDAFRLNYAVQPSADSAHRNVGLRFDVVHGVGAFDLTSPTALLGIQGGVVQNVAATTAANVSGLRGAVSATAGTITTGRIFDARMGTVADAGIIGTEIGYDIIVNATPAGGVTARYGMRIPAMAAGGVTTAIGIYLEDAGIQIAPNDEAAIVMTGGNWSPVTEMGIGEWFSNLLLQGLNSMYFVIDPGDAGARNFYWYHGGDTNTGTLIMQLSEAGQLSLPISGAAAGLLLGGDVLLYRAAANVLQTPDSVRIQGTTEMDGALNHDGATVGFFGTVPAAQTAAYVQTYATADRTHANPTAAAVGDLVATSGGWGYYTEAAADSVWQTLDALVADMADIKQLVNAIIDDLQLYGLLA